MVQVILKTFVVRLGLRLQLTVEMEQFKLQTMTVKMKNAMEQQIVFLQEKLMNVNVNQGLFQMVLEDVKLLVAL